MRTLIRLMLDRLPYVGGLREQVRHVGSYPAGHYYSPIPTPAEVSGRFKALEKANDGVAGVNLNREKQLDTIQQFQTFYNELPFPEEQTSESRYYFDQTVFCYADAIFLYSFLRHIQPRRIIEVGSGFSSTCWPKASARSPRAAGSTSTLCSPRPTRHWRNTEPVRIQFTPSGRAQFLAAVDFIRRDNPNAARQFRQRAGQALRRLERFPASGRKIPEFPDLPHRELIVRPYRFFYRTQAKIVWIVAVWHGAHIGGTC